MYDELLISGVLGSDMDHLKTRSDFTGIRNL